MTNILNARFKYLNYGIAHLKRTLNKKSNNPDKTGMAEEANLQALLEKNVPSCATHLRSVDELLNDATPVCEHASALAERLRQLKCELKAVQAKRYFLNKVVKESGAAGADGDFVALFPSSSEAADLEVQLAREKTELRAAKKRRAAQEMQLRDAAARYAASYSALEETRAEATRLLRASRVMGQMRAVADALRADDREALERLAADPELCAGAARALADGLASDAYEARSRADAASATEAHMRGQLAAQAEQRERLRRLLSDLTQQLDEKEQADERAQALKRELDELNAMSEVNECVSGCSVDSINDDEVKLTIHADAFDAQKSASLEKNGVQRQLTVRFRDGRTSQPVSATLSVEGDPDRQENTAAAGNTCSLPVIVRKAIVTATSHIYEASEQAA